MNSAQLYEEVKNSLLIDTDGVEDIKKTTKGLRVVMEDKAIFLISISRVDDDEEDLEEDEDDEDEEDLDDDEDDEDWDDEDDEP
jgi:hypothetical protein